MSNAGDSVSGPDPSFEAAFSPDALDVAYRVIAHELRVPGYESVQLPSVSSRAPERGARFLAEVAGVAASYAALAIQMLANQWGDNDDEARAETLLNAFANQLRVRQLVDPDGEEGASAP